MRYMRMIAHWALLLLIATTATAQPYKPATDFETTLDTFFDAANGHIRFQDHVVSFPGMMTCSIRR